MNTKFHSLVLVVFIILLLMMTIDSFNGRQFRKKRLKHLNKKKKKVSHGQTCPLLTDTEVEVRKLPFSSCLAYITLGCEIFWNKETCRTSFCTKKQLESDICTANGGCFIRNRNCKRFICKSQCRKAVLCKWSKYKKKCIEKIT